MLANGSITIVAQEYAVSFGAYLLEEAFNHKSDCAYEQPFALKLHMENPRLNPQIKRRGRAHHIFTVP